MNETIREYSTLHSYQNHPPDSDQLHLHRPLTKNIPRNDLLDPSLSTFDIQGLLNPLSNFFPCQFLPLPSKLLKDAAQINSTHLTIKAFLCRDIDTANYIIQTRDAATSKRITHRLKYNQHMTKCNQEKEDLMAELLFSKAHQVPEFRKTILDTGHWNITHPVHDK